MSSAPSLLLAPLLFLARASAQETPLPEPGGAVFLAEVAATNPADAPTASLITRLLRQELRLSLPNPLIQEENLGGTAGGLAPRGESCAGKDCFLERARRLGAAFLVSGTHGKTPDGDGVQFFAYDIGAGRLIHLSRAEILRDQSMTPDIQAAADRMAAAIRGEPVDILVSRREAVLERLGRKDPFTAVLRNALPGGGMYYAGRPGWALAYMAAQTTGGFFLIRDAYHGDADRALWVGTLACAAKVAELYHSLHEVHRHNRSLGLAVIPSAQPTAMLALAIPF